MKFREKYLNTAGIGMILLGLVGIIINIQLDSVSNIVWFCNHTSIILGLAFLFRSRYWVSAEISLALIPQVLWTIDYLGKLLFDWFPFGFTEYMFSPDYASALYYLSLNHLIIIPIALVGLWYLGKPVVAWEGAFVHGFLLIIPSYLTGLNTNCILESCVPFIPTTSFYPVIWIAQFMIVILFTNWVLVKMGKKLKKN